MDISLSIGPGRSVDADEDKYGKRRQKSPFKERLILALMLVAFLFLARSYYYQGSSDSSEEFSISADNSTIVPPNQQQLPNKEQGDKKSDRKKTMQLQARRREQVVNAFRHAWKGYRQFAYGKDMLMPLSRHGEDWFGMGLTMIDALDTALLMGCTDISDDVSRWIDSDLKFEHAGNSNVFEVTIRVLGGLLTAHHLTGSGMYLDKAKELADLMLPAFDTPSGVPMSSVDFSTKNAVQASEGASTAEATTLQLEWRYLTILTGETKYWAAVEKVMHKFFESDPPGEEGLVPIFIDNHSGTFKGRNIRLGSRGDSYYEYLAKQYIQTSGIEHTYAIQFEEAMKAVLTHLKRESEPSKLVYVGELPEGIGGNFSPKMDHLVCFLPGTVALYISGGRRLKVEDMDQMSEEHQELIHFAVEMTETCYRMYKDMKSGLAPEIVYFNTDAKNNVSDIQVHNGDAHNLLRPETVESLFYMYRITGDEKYREYGWEIFQAFEKHTRVEGGGYACLDDVRTDNPPKRDKMESFWLGETLKYFYLLFSEDDVWSLEKYVFNTEAHPFPIVQLDEEMKQKLAQAKLGMWSEKDNRADE